MKFLWPPNKSNLLFEGNFAPVPLEEVVTLILD